MGVFTYGPARDRFSFFINSGTSASNIEGGSQLNRKSDNSNYTYIGRSFGVGSSVGILDHHLQEKYPHMTQYTFNEIGYNTKWTCAYNRSTVARLERIDNNSFFVVNPIQGGYPVADWGWDAAQNPQITASLTWLGAMDSDGACTQDHPEPYKYISIVATDIYKELNATQCYVSFQPTRFLVDVDVTNRLILVAPHETEGVQIIDCTGTQAWRAYDTLSALSMVSTTSYTSSIGNMLQSNIYNVKQQARANETDARKVLRGIEESLQAITDQYLFSAAGVQLIIANNTGLATVSVHTRGFRIGQLGYIFAVLVVNFLILAVVVLGSIRTRMWRGLPKLNFADVKSVVVAGAFGGEEMWRRTRAGYADVGERWVGDTSSSITGAIKVQIVATQNGVGLEVR
ncbi:hypothetical protein CC86DRAFT_464501 [Ophiobolus disseminans]|uniref:Uncharacterized protein n=1 Tax=Ophiobolus disseminans TaxID=1469910 RepID=A0A6A7A9T0_9PLEO|nr:hypothetical protein CC86DRAFT_464501 [Ophiobolus disseminans]